MPDFVNVPVPSHLVVEVMKFIASVDESTAKADPSVDEAIPASSSWDRSELEIIQKHRSSMPSVDLFAQVLSQLAEISPVTRRRDDIAADLGEEGLTMVKKFGAVTRFINKRIPSQRNSWPLVWADGMWGMDRETAELWKAITGGDAGV